MNLFTVLFISCYLILVTDAQTYRRACYYTNWSQYRSEPGKYVPENIDPTLCSHLIYAFCSMSNNEVTTLEWNDVDMYARFNNLRAKNPSVKLLLAVAGWSFDLTKMTAMLATASTRAQFVRSAIAFLRKYNFDGFDLDFEWPGRPPSPPSDREKFTLLVQELRDAFNNEPTTKAKLLLTIAVPATQSALDVGFEIAKIAKNVDFITIMSYDYNGAWNSVTGHNSPLYAPSNNPADSLNIQATITYMSTKGVPMSVLNLGVPFYGRGFLLANPANYGLGAPSKGASPPGPTTKEAGYMAYYEVMKYVIDSKTKIYKPCDIQVPYLVNADLWMGYDDVSSVENKADYIRKKALGGFSVWSLDQDDFKGTYGTVYPLLKKLNEINSANFVNTFKCTSKRYGHHGYRDHFFFNNTVVASDRVVQRASYNCEDSNPCTAENIANGQFYFSATDPSQFIQCSAHGQCFTMNCPPTLVWQQDILNCNHPATDRRRRNKIRKGSRAISA